MDRSSSPCQSSWLSEQITRHTDAVKAGYFAAPLTVLKTEYFNTAAAPSGVVHTQVVRLNQAEPAAPSSCIEMF